MSGEAYWLALLSGMSQIEEARELAEDNVYLRSLARGIQAGKMPGLKPLVGNPADLRARMSPRMEALSRAVRERDVGDSPDLPIA